MPVLLYCIAAAADEFQKLLNGVAGLEVQRAKSGELAAYFSESDVPEAWLRLPLRDAALQFHRVLMQFFETATILPFQFPTVFETEDSLKDHIATHSANYTLLLERFRNHVQMDVRVTNRRSGSATASSGTQFLRERLDRRRTLDSVEHALRDGTGGIVVRWVRQDVSDGFRASALVDRGKLDIFNTNLAAIQLETGMQARVSGPWPVTAFINSPLESES